MKWKVWLRIGLQLVIAAHGVSNTSLGPHTPTASLIDAQPFFGGALLTSSKVLMVGGTSSLPKGPWKHATPYLFGVEGQKFSSGGHNSSNKATLAHGLSIPSTGTWTRGAVIRVGASSPQGTAATRALTAQHALYTPKHLQDGWGLVANDNGRCLALGTTAELV